MHSENSSNSEAGQEIRFAVAMSGGVSLAVWMGGVAREINLLQQASNLRAPQNSPASADGAAPDRDWDEKCRELYRQLLAVMGQERPAHAAPPRAGEQRRSAVDIRKAAREMDWRPEVTLREGLARTVAYFKQAMSY